MRRFRVAIFGGLVLSLAAGGVAFAADMAVKAPPPPIVAPPTWDGLYSGINGGYSVGHDPFTQTDFGFGPDTMIATPQGALFGAQAGYNWQRGNIVLGVEGDAQWTGQQSTTCGVTCLQNYLGEYDSVTVSQKLLWLLTARTRVGYANGNYFLYVTGGGAWGGLKETIQPQSELAAFIPLNYNAVLDGWVGGAGLEIMLGGHWSAKVEYLHVDLGRLTTTGTVPMSCIGAGCAGPISDATTASVRDDIVRFGVNYRFADGAAVAATGAAWGAPPALVPVALGSWTGFYAGLNAGYGYGSDKFGQTFAPGSAFPVFTHSSVTVAPEGPALGGQAGYNWQADHVVFGIEADADWTNQRGTSCTIQCATDGSLMTTQTYKWLATARGRIGYENGGWLIYGTAGGAFAGIKENDVFIVPDSSTFNVIRGGWTCGAGIETKLVGHWTGRIEFLHYDFGSMSNTYAPDSVTTNSRLTDNLARIALNYQFH